MCSTLLTENRKSIHQWLLSRGTQSYMVTVNLEQV